MVDADGQAAGQSNSSAQQEQNCQYYFCSGNSDYFLKWVHYAKKSLKGDQSHQQAGIDDSNFLWRFTKIYSKNEIKMLNSLYVDAFRTKMYCLIRKKLNIFNSNKAFSYR
ncbi:hypothetical protein BpHYR1_051711 [Brachionus plicatilis]|uniref:Uncharacterized protein n=1 Tax=Brachionus plicatilis TaxID=10195 RepID=A0A3M7QJI7_BRAPC|nr:hypothetical protein BpHYR1_051711 [Brachionus plicatilis]